MCPYSLYICNKIIRIEDENFNFLRACRGFIIKEPAPTPDYTIRISKATKEGSVIPEDMSELRCLRSSRFVILQDLATSLLKDERTLLIHGSAIAYKESAFLFSASSGTGKTTHSRLWIDNLPGTYILNGDKPFVSTGEKVTAWGSPWCGSEGERRNKGVELKAICFLERSGRNHLTEITADEAIPMLALQTGDPAPEDYHTKVWMMEGLNRLRGRVKFFRYEMNNLKKEEAFHTTFDVLSKL